MADDDRGARIFIPDSHIFRDRTQGCWNCKHSKSGVERWTQERQKNGAQAIRIAQESPMGENDTRVLNIRTMVNKLDHAIASHSMLECTGKGTTADGKPVGDFVPNNYLCEKWSGAQGASLARTFGKTEKLPEELAADLHGAPMDPIPSLDSLLAEKNK